MGLTKGSTGVGVLDTEFLSKRKETDKIIALAGNPNVGKSTVFNGLTGMNQHTGNWPGKTVATAQGYYKGKNNSFLLVDIPGTYSLSAHSAEEECARDFICFKNPDGVVVVCDGVSLERNLNLVLQIMETGQKTAVCVNLLDEAKRKGIEVNTAELSKILGVPVVGAAARNRRTLAPLKAALDEFDNSQNRFRIEYPAEIEMALALIESSIKPVVKNRLDCRWLSLKILSGDNAIIKGAEEYLGIALHNNEEIKNSIEAAFDGLLKMGLDLEKVGDIITSTVVKTAQEISRKTVKYGIERKGDSDRRIDRVLTGKYTAYPIMLLLLGVVLWITIVGANYPSAWLSALFSKGEKLLNSLFFGIDAPEWLRGITVDGAYKVLTWVVAVMLPPMAIFFPFFTLLEDFGYLPRIAYNLDRPFKKCSACGKQALTICMGFGCNAAGVTGCRIIDSKRERLLAILTNSFIPCNGRFPALIAVITMFFTLTASGITGSLMSAAILCSVIVLSILITLFATRILAKTVLKGVPSSFTLELPPYRKPRVGEVIVRSVFDRTLFVLGRAVCVAIPAGIIIWLAANIKVGNVNLLNYCADILDPIASFFGMDGVILISFILGFPANEIVIPLMIMAYTSSGTLIEVSNLAAVKDLFINNGWSITTAICVIIFMVMHWPCSTTLLTVKKETGSVKWTALAFVLPTIMGLLICAAVTFMSKILF